MPLSINKLIDLLLNKGFYTRSFYKIYNVCAFIEILSSTTGNMYMLYIPSRYTFKIDSKNDNIFDLKAININLENNDSDILREYAEKPNSLDIEDEYKQIYLSNPQLFEGEESAEKFLENKYKKQIEIVENNNSENVDIKCILRQINRFKYCVQNVDYRIVLIYKSYMCFLHTEDVLDVYYIQNYPTNNFRKLFVTFDLEMLYNNNNILLELVQVKNGIEKIIDKNHEFHIHNLQNLINNKERSVNYVKAASIKKTNCNIYVEQFSKLLGLLYNNETELEKKIKIINTANSDNLYKDIEYSHQKNKLVKELRHIQKIKSDLIQNIINLKNQSNNISLTIDKILFDNTVLMDRVFKNLDMLSTLCL